MALRATAPTGPDLPARIGAWETVLKERGFAGVVSVRGGEQALIDYADVGSEPGRVFWIGSVSKQFASVAVLRLAADGALSLDDPVGTHLPEVSDTLQKDGVACSLRHLLSHTCGLPPGSLLCPDLDLQRPENEARYLRCVSGLELDSTPGEAYRYANLGFGLAGVIVARRSSQTYEAFLRSRFFEPLGMKDTGVDLAARPDLIGRLARGELELFGLGLDSATWYAMDVLGPGRRGASGNIFSTAADLHRWNRALHKGALLPPELYTQLATPVLEDYGLGIVVEEERGEPWYWHNGGLTPMAYGAYLAFVSSLDLSVVVLGNRTPPVSHMDAIGVGLVRSGLASEVAALAPLRAADRAADLVFVALPMLVFACILGFLVALVVGPRRSFANWAASILLTSSLATVLSLNLDFYDAHALWPGALLLALGVGLAASYRRWRLRLGELRASRKERINLLCYGGGVAVLLWVADGAARLWVLGDLGLFFAVVGAGALLHATGRKGAGQAQA